MSPILEWDGAIFVRTWFWVDDFSNSIITLLSPLEKDTTLKLNSLESSKFKSSLFGTGPVVLEN